MTTPHTDAQKCCEKCFDSREAHTVDGVYFPPQEFCKQSNCPCHTPHTTSSGEPDVNVRTWMDTGPEQDLFNE